MNKIIVNVRNSFSSKSNNTKYQIEIFTYFVFLTIFTMLNIMCIIFDKNDKHYEGITLIGVILSSNFILFVWQTIAFSFRLYEVRNNKIDMKIMDGDYVFKGEPIEVIYKDLKKILNKTNGGFKLYCKGNDGKNHIIRTKVLVHDKERRIERNYYFDRVQYDFGKVLMLMNELNLVRDSKVTILGNNIEEKNNFEYIKCLLKKYG